MAKTTVKNSFENFTNLYELSKTLRFELKPMGNTQKMLKDNKIFAEDEKKKKAYEKIKPYFDRLHQEFVFEALSDITLLGLKEYFDLFQEWGKDKKNAGNTKKLDDKKKELRKQVVNYFDATGKKWAEKKYAHLKIKQKDSGILFEKEIFGILKDRYGEDLETQFMGDQADKKTGEITKKKFSIFDEWSGFTGYFIKFHETRKNFYKDDGTSTALATRIIDHNLDRFLENIQIFESIKAKLNISETEKFFKKSAKTVFSFGFYNKCVLQNGIDEYNDFLGGKTLENGIKEKGVNEIINKYRQDHPGEKLSYLKKLDNQILSEKEKKIFVLETDEECINVLKTFQKNAKIKISILQNLVKDLIGNESKYTLEKIYISKEAFNTISRKWTNETSVFEEKLFEVLKEKKLVKPKKKDTEGFSFPDFIALEYIRTTLEKLSSDGRFWKERYYINKEDKKSIGFLSEKEDIWQQFFLILGAEFSTLFKRIVENENGEKIETGYSISKEKLQKILGKENILKDKMSKVVIKNFADDVLRIYQMGKYFAVEKKRAWDDRYEIDDFYTKPEIGYLAFYDGAYKQIVQAYNDIRNYLTKKPYSEEKWKLNFENPTLANGWDKNKESDNSAVILRKNGKYYLGLMKKGCNKIFDEKNKSTIEDGLDSGSYEKMVYKLLPNPFTDLPHICFSAKGRDFFHPSDEIFKIYKNGKFKKGEYFSVESMQKLIGFYKNCLTRYEGWKSYDFKNVKSSKSYQNNIGEFYADVAKAGYKVWFEQVSETYINKKNKDGELYLFKIYNQDFASGKTGKKNLHTMYWEALFSKDNMKEFLFKLNGQAEIFYRPKSIEAETEKRSFPRDIVKKQRYAKDKIFFHCPITLNREKGKALRFNQNLNNFLAQNTGINIIGVDRGEKHLAYYSVIKQNGEVVESGSLNSVNDINYGEKLEARAKGREQARKDWQDVEGIKNLKKGYISQVVRKLADLAIKYNAIIVFEDLNMRFKQIRGGIEKSVYQQLEKALVEKLSFLVKKGEKNPLEPGHLLKAYQLTAPFETFQKMGKQTGILFYTQASYTSKIDPVTGWRPNLYLKNINVKNNKAAILKFDKIKLNKEKNRFEFTYDLKNFFPSQVEYPKKTEWTLCSCVERWRWNRKLANNKGDYEHYEDITDNFKDLFKGKIDLENGNIIGQIKELEEKGNEKFFSDFIFYFGLMCQIRNTDGQLDKKIKKLQKENGASKINNDDKNNVDFILSPTAPFFDSRKSEKFGENLPKNGDDNGAYNIARKGIVILEKISKFYKDNKNCDKMTWGDLYASHIDWDNFSQK